MRLAAGLLFLIVAAEPSPRPSSLEEASLLVLHGEYDRALGLARKIAAEAARRGDVGTETTARLRAADVLFDRGRIDEYRRECETVLALRERAGDAAGKGEALYYLAYAYQRREPARMLALLEQALAAAEAAGDPRLTMKVHNALGSTALEQGRYAQALAAFRRSAEMARALGGGNNLGVALGNQAVVEIQRGNPLAGLTLLAESMPLCEHAGNRLVHAHQLNSSAEAHELMGDLEQGRRQREGALAVLRELGQKRGLATTLAALAATSHELGQTERAEAELREALALSVELQDARRTVEVLIDLGRLAAEAGRAELAAERLREALARALRYGDPNCVAQASVALGQLELERGDSAAALAAATRARELSAAIGEPIGEGLALALEADLMERAGRSAAAARALERAIRLHRAARTRAELPDWLARRARLVAASGDAAAARKLFDEALAEVEELDRLTRLAPFRLALFRKANRAFSAYAAWLVERGEHEKAWDVVEQGRARELRVRLERVAFAFAADAERDALARIAALQKELAEAPEHDARQRLLRELGMAENAYEQARGAAATAVPLPPAEVLARAPSADVVVEYARAGERLLVFSRRANEVRARMLPDAGALLRRALRYRDAVADRRAPFSAAAEARALGETLLGPELLGLAGGGLLIVPDDALSVFPWAALQSPDGAWLMERWALAQAPSLGALAGLAKSTTSERRRVLAIASTHFDGLHAAPGLAALPAAYAEARAVAGHRRGQLLVDPEEAAFKRLPLEEYDVVHFATHALVDERQPERSAVALAPGGGEDGLLLARELYGLRLPARLVVVSSCRGASGAHVAGEGVLGLSHAFFCAGARSLVSALWDVSDSGSAEAMRLFYAGLERTSATEALAQAQRAMSRTPAYAHPAHWAGYVLAGDGDARGLVERGAFPSWVWMLAAAASLVGVAVWLRRRPAPA